MSPKPQAAQLREMHVTPGQLEMRDWHIFLGKAAQAAAIALILGSYVALQWAAHFVGLRPLGDQMLVVGWFATLMSFVVPLAIEGGMAVIGATLTTVETGTRLDAVTGEIRKVPRAGLVVIFCFLMALAQAANIGHAVVAAHSALTGPEGTTLPPELPVWVIYTFACAFAALFPLGGTLMVYVAGYLREHGTGAKWITEETEKVHVEVAPGQAGTVPAAAPARKATVPAPAPRPAAAPRTESALAATVAAANARNTESLAEAAPLEETATNVRQLADPMQAAARVEFDRMVEADAWGPDGKIDAAVIHRAIGSTANVSTTRRWVRKWEAEYAAAMPAVDRDELVLPQADEPKGETGTG